MTDSSGTIEAKISDRISWLIKNFFSILLFFVCPYSICVRTFWSILARTFEVLGVSTVGGVGNGKGFVLKWWDDRRCWDDDDNVDRLGWSKYLFFYWMKRKEKKMKPEWSVVIKSLLCRSSFKNSSFWKSIDKRSSSEYRDALLCSPDI